MTVNDRILAVHVLQRFVRMSRILLPGFSELMSKNNPTTEERLRILKIKDIYESFRVNPELSVQLINSNIFQLILEVYRNTIQRSGSTPQNFHTYDEFLKESDRLIDTWDHQLMN